MRGLGNANLSRERAGQSPEHPLLRERPSPPVPCNPWDPSAEATRSLKYSPPAAARSSLSFNTCPTRPLRQGRPGIFSRVLFLRRRSGPARGRREAAAAPRRGRGWSGAAVRGAEPPPRRSPPPCSARSAPGGAAGSPSPGSTERGPGFVTPRAPSPPYCAALRGTPRMRVPAPRETVVLTRRAELGKSNPRCHQPL